VFNDIKTNSAEFEEMTPGSKLRQAMGQKRFDFEICGLALTRFSSVCGALKSLPTAF